MTLHFFVNNVQLRQLQEKYQLVYICRYKFRTLNVQIITPTPTFATRTLKRGHPLSDDRHIKFMRAHIQIPGISDNISVCVMKQGVRQFVRNSRKSNQYLGAKGCSGSKQPGNKSFNQTFGACKLMQSSPRV